MTIGLVVLNCVFMDADVVFILQQSMVVPPTPLHTSRVLTEDKELWDDVKVRPEPFKSVYFQNVTTRWQ